MTVYTASLAARRLSGPDFDAPCAFGRAGLVTAADKREGDQASPIGTWPVRRMFHRTDRINAPCGAVRADPIAADDGWCDAPGHPAYNRLVRLPFKASHETLRREDGLYDLIVVLGHNDDPPAPGLGSAIFLHCALPDATDGLRPTAGCVAIPRDPLIRLATRLAPGDAIAIAP